MLLTDTVSTSGALLLPDTGAFATFNGVERNFIWSDRSAVPHSTSSTDWFDGAYVTSFPVDAEVITKN